MTWRREPVVYDGQTVQIPLPAGQGTGLGKPLKLINHPKRADIPIFWASLMGKSVADTARLANGWLPIFFDPEKFQQVWGDDLAAGLADRDPSLGPLQISAGGMVAIGDEYAGDGADRVLDMARPTHGAVRRRHGRPGQELLQHDRQEVRLRRRGHRDPGPLPVRAQGGGGRRRAPRSCSPAPTSSARSPTSPSASPPTRRPASRTCRSTRSAPTRSRRRDPPLPPRLTADPCSRPDVVPARRAPDARTANTRRQTMPRSHHMARAQAAARRTRASGGPAPRQLGDDLDLLAERVAEAVLDALVGVGQLGARRRLVGRAAGRPRRPARAAPAAPARARPRRSPGR